MTALVAKFKDIFYEEAETENGARSLATTTSPLVDLYFKLVRDISDETINTLFPASWNAQPLETLKLVFQTRDCRGIGKGDRKSFWKMVHWMMNNKLHAHLGQNLSFLPEYGYWKDLLGFMNTPLESYALKLMAKQLLKDICNMEKGEKVSLVAKYAPTPNKKHDKETNVVRKLIDVMKEMYKDKEGIPSIRNEADYRKNYLSPLREYLQIVERLMCEQRWYEIKYSSVPSVAMKRLRKAFEKHTPEQWKRYMEGLETGEEKVKAKQLYPHEIIGDVLKQRGNDALTQRQWEQQIEKITETARTFMKKTLVVSDVSGSMEGVPMLVSIALGLLIVEFLDEPWKDLLITFSEKPTFHKVVGKSIYDRARSVKNMSWGGSTDLTKTFSIILNRCVEHHVAQEDMPEKLLILSDMQFNQTDTHWETNHKMIERKFTQAGYNIPQIIFWNLRGNTKDFPVSAHAHNTVCLSGYSPTILNALMNGDVPSPVKIVHDIVNNARYEKIKLYEQEQEHEQEQE